MSFESAVRILCSVDTSSAAAAAAAAAQQQRTPRRADRTAFANACATGNFREVSRLLSSNSMGRGAITKALVKALVRQRSINHNHHHHHPQQLEIVALLLAYGADYYDCPSAGTTTTTLRNDRQHQCAGFSALHHASYGHQENVPLVRLLLFHDKRQNEEEEKQAAAAAVTTGTLLRVKDRQGRTALFVASERGHTETIRWLLKEEEEQSTDSKDGSGLLDTKNAQGETALHAAVSRGHADTVQVLLDAYYHQKLAAASSDAAQHVNGDDKKMNETTTDAKNKPNQSSLLELFGLETRTELLTAAVQAGGDGSVVRLLLEQGTTAAASDINPHDAAKRGDGGGDEDDERAKALLVAAEMGNWTAARFLLQHNGGMVGNEATAAALDQALLVAAGAGHWNMARLLLDHGAKPNARADPNARDGQEVLLARRRWMTALETAVERDDIGLAKLLLDYGASPNLPNRLWGGQTVLHRVAGKTKGCKRDNMKLLKLLLESNADTRIRDSNGRVPLDLACSGSSHLASVKDVSPIYLLFRSMVGTGTIDFK